MVFLNRPLVCGFWVNDELIYGKETYLNGDYYEGYFDKNRSHGYGKYYFKNENIYEGEWVRNIWHG